MTLAKLCLDIHDIRGKEVIILGDFRRVSYSRHLRVQGFLIGRDLLLVGAFGVH